MNSEKTKAPNKIYIDKEIGFSKSSSDSAICWSYKPPFDSIEYIRKDVLMEIIKAQKQIALGFSYEHIKLIEDKINLL